MRVTCLVFAVLLAVSATAHAGGSVDEAREQLRTGDDLGAIEKARAALASEPSNARAARLLQDLLLRAGRNEEAEKLANEGVKDPVLRSWLQARVLVPDEAAKALRKLKGEDGAPPEVQLDLAWALYRSDSMSNADSEAKSYVKSNPEDAEGHYLMAVIEVARDRARTATPDLEKAVELEPGWAPPTVLLAEILHRLGKPADARQVLQKALAKYPANVDLRLGLAQDHLRVNEIDEALKLLQALAAERGANAGVHAWLAHAHRLLGELAEAEAAAQKALALDPAYPVALETIGFCRIKAGKAQEGIDAYAAAMRADRLRIEPYVGIALGQTQLNLLDDAEEMLEKALKIDKDHIDANLRMGIVQYLKGKYKNATKYLKAVIKMDDENIPAYRYSGYVSLAQGKAKEALSFFQEALRLDASDVETTRMMARAYVDLGRLEEALQSAERAVALNEKDPWAQFDLGKCRDKMEDYGGAKEAYETALELSAGFVWPHLYLAEIYDEIDGDTENALLHYKRYLEMEGPDPEGRIKQRVEQLSD